MMKRVIIFLCLLFILPTPLFAQDEFKFQKILFFEAGDDAPEASQRNYMVQFPKSTTRYVWTQVDVQNLLYNVRKHTHKVMWRYYNSDGTLRGEVSTDFRIKTTWYTAWHQHRWGWSQPGNWPVGTNRVEVWIDGKKFGQDLFTIYDDRVSPPSPVASSVGEKTYLEFEFVKFFESGYTAPPESQRQYKTDFPRSTTRYINFLVGAKNLLYRNRAHKPLVIGRYYYPNGTFFGEAKLSVDIPPDWENADLWTGWGWNEPGKWTLGTFRVEIFFGNTKVGEGRFTIYDDRK